MKETILLLGGDGYYGWPLALKLAINHPNTKILIVDNEFRRNTVVALGSNSLIPIARPADRIAAYKAKYGQDNLQYIKMDVNTEALEELIKTERPHTIYHLAQQCSAPYSMLGLNESLFTINNNEGNNMRLLWAVRKHLPETHIIKLGSMGEYANGGIDIAEGYFLPQYNGKTATKPMPFPRSADDVYHISKINDSNYIGMAARKWGLRITEVMQSTLFGVYIDEMDGCEALLTRFDYDDVFGTVVNRFLTQAVAGHPITVYGKGNQTTGIMPLRDAVNSLARLACTEGPAGVHTVVNNVTFANCSINEIAQNVKALAEEHGYKADITHVFDPRSESHLEKHDIKVASEFVDNNISVTPLNDVLKETLAYICRYQDRICYHAFTHHIGTEEPKGIELPATAKAVTVTNEQHWRSFREHYFRSGTINLNPGTLGNTSAAVKSIRREGLSNPTFGASPLGMYEYGRKNLGQIKELAAELWPSDGYELVVANGTSQTINLMALAMLRAFNQKLRAPFRVLTSTHEHPGGIGVFEQLPEYEVHYIDDATLNDSTKLAQVVKDVQPDVAFISQVYYATGNFAPLDTWFEAVKTEAPGCKIILDVTQSIGLYDIPFGEADAVIGSAHKWLFGPHGSGLTWLKDDFANWIGGLFWNGNAITHNQKGDRLCLQGGHDFTMYAEVLEALKLYKEVGKDVVLQRSSHLSNLFRSKLQQTLSAHGIRHTVLNDSDNAPLLSVALHEYNPFRLYTALNDGGMHLKCLIDYKHGEESCHILRFGLPYYETADRLDHVIAEIEKQLSVAQKQTIELTNLQAAA